MNDSTRSMPTRRDFVAALAIVAAATVAPTLAQDVKLPDAKAHADALETIIRYRFGKQLTDEQIKRVHASALRGRANSDAMKKTELRNGEDPIVAFRADLP